MSLRSGQEASVAGAKWAKESVGGRKAREVTGDGGDGVTDPLRPVDPCEGFGLSSKGSESHRDKTWFTFEQDRLVGAGGAWGQGWSGGPGRPGRGKGGLSQPVTVPEVRGRPWSWQDALLAEKWSVEGRREDGAQVLASGL